MKKSTQPFLTEWFIYTDHSTTFDHITQYLRDNGDRQGDAHMTGQVVSDLSHPVTLRAINLADKRTLDGASNGPLQLKFKIYIRQYPGGPIQYFEKRKPDIGYPKIVLLVSNILTHDQLVEHAGRLEDEHPKIRYVIAEKDLVGAFDAMIVRGFVDEIGLYGGKLGLETVAYEMIEIARKRNLPVVAMDTVAVDAVAALGGSRKRGRRAA